MPMPNPADPIFHAKLRRYLILDGSAAEMQKALESVFTLSKRGEAASIACLLYASLGFAAAEDALGKALAEIASILKPEGTQTLRDAAVAKTRLLLDVAKLLGNTDDEGKVTTEHLALKAESVRRDADHALSLEQENLRASAQILKYTQELDAAKAELAKPERAAAEELYRLKRVMGLKDNDTAQEFVLRLIRVVSATERKLLAVREHAERIRAATILGILDCPFNEPAHSGNACPECDDDDPDRAEERARALS